MHRFTRNDVKDALIFFRKHQTKTLESVKNVTKYVHSKLFRESSIFTSLAGHILDALRRNNKTGVINSEFCIRMIQLARIRM